MYRKATETAIAAMSRLAEVYDNGKTRLSATKIADSRGLQRPFVAKILWTLSQAQLIDGARGPGGGFTLAMHPKEITLYDVYVLFEHAKESPHCPIGGGLCGGKNVCPLHNQLADVRKAMDKVLHRTTFDTFRKAYKKSNNKADWRFENA